MIKLALAVGFLSVFGTLAWLAFVWITKNFFTEQKKEEKSVDTSQTTTEQTKNQKQ